MGFLQMDHTHSDIDNTFSCTSRRLRTENEITIDDLHVVLRKGYNDFTKVSSFKQIAHKSLLYEESGF